MVWYGMVGELVTRVYSIQCDPHRYTVQPRANMIMTVTID